MTHTWDSVRALNGDGTTAGQGWDTDLSPSMGGALTQTVAYTDAAGTVWSFPYTSYITDTAPYTAYRIPPGQPWALSTSPITGYTLANILTGQTLTFDAQGRLQAATDAYGNSNTLTAGTNQPTSETNSNVDDGTTGRALAVTYNGSGQLADAQSPLWQSQGAGAAGSQHVTYGYNPQGQLTTLTRRAGTPDALTETFGYSGAELVTVTTPYTQSQHTWTLGYDPQGRVTALTSPGQGQPGQAGYTPSYTTQFTYEVSQTVVVEGVGTSGALTHTYTLDAEGNAPQLTDVAGQGHVRTATFDIDHDVISGTDALGNTTLYTHTYMGPTGNVGLLTEEDQPAIRNGGFSGPLTPVVTRYSYDPNTHDRTAVFKPNGGETAYAYDGHHSVTVTTERLVSNCGPSCGSYQRRGTIDRYDPYGELVATTDGRGVDATDDGVATLDPTTAISYTGVYTYSPQGDQVAASTPPITTTLNGVTRANAPVTTSSTYDADGNEIASTSANGNTSTTTYDHLGRAAQASAPAVTLWDGTTVAPTITTRYDGDGNVISTQDPTGAVTVDGYDPLGRLVTETNAANETTVMTYTATRKTFDRDPAGNVTAYRYNGGGEVIHVSDPVSGTIDYNYDGVGNTIAITTSDGTTGNVSTVETRRYDALNQPISSTVRSPDGSAATTQQAYDLDGNLAATQQPDGTTTTYGYDLADERVSMIDAGGLYSYSYDLAGNRVETNDIGERDHQTIYDADNRAVRQVDSTPAGASASAPTMTTMWSYDPDGNTLNRVQQTAGQAPVTYSAAYNADDWVTSATEGGTTTGYGYDADKEIRSQTLMGGGNAPITRDLDPLGRTVGIGERTGGTGPYTATFGYDTNNLPVTITLPGGVTQTGAYDRGGRLVGVGATGPTTAPTALASAYSYGYDPYGETAVVTTTLNGQTSVQRYNHDGLGRLTGVAGGPSWTYDANDNISTTVSGGVTTRYTYSSSVPNQLQSVSASGAITAYGYDKTGNATSITSTGGISTGLAYDSEGRLSQVTLADGARVAMGYNSLGRRTSYTVTTGGVVSLGEAFGYRGSELAQAVVTGTSVSVPYTDTYVYNAQGGPLELLRTTAAGTARYWYELDGRGNVVALTDANGSVVDRYGYDAWGRPLAAQTSEQVSQPFRYAGYWYDKELGWYWLALRAYDPGLARFLQLDPSGQDGVRDYVYASDDPLDGIDPLGFGLCEVPLLGGVTCAGGAVLHGAWQFVAGDDFQTLSDPNASFGAKAFAIVDLGSNATLLLPIVGEGVEGVKFGAKGLYYVGRKLVAREFRREEVEKALRRGYRIAEEAGALSCARCFPAGTGVATPHGVQPIDKLRVGNTVLSENPKTGKVENETVEAVIHDPVSPLIAVQLSDSSSITVTANHPFWLDFGTGSKLGGWIAADQLRPGDHLRTASGRGVTVVGLRAHVGRAAVYTLTVTKDHTFFVGAARVLVHNADCFDTKRIADEVAQRIGSSAEEAQGEGWRIRLRGSSFGKKRDIVVRVMNRGGGREEPYFRVDIDGKGGVTISGEISGDRGLTHHGLETFSSESDIVETIVRLVEQYAR